MYTPAAATDQMPYKRDGDRTVGYSGESEPYYDDNLELLEVDELGDHAHSDGRSQTAACN